MSKASLSTGNGPGSSITLAPETIRVRDALIEKFSGAPLEDMNNFMTMALSNETDEFRRLGILAARIYVLRSRVANLKEFNRNPSLTALPTLDTTTLSHNLPASGELTMAENDEVPSETDQWSRIQMTEPGEVNGVRFLAGTIIDAQPQDANKLISSNKAVRVDMEGSIIDDADNNLTDFDAAANSSDDSTPDAVGDAAESPTSDDDETAAAELDEAPMSEEPQETSDDEAKASDNGDEAPKEPSS